MTVQFSCRCPNADYLGFEASPEAIIATAVKAESIGFDAVFVNDHIIVDQSPRSTPWTNTYDPLIALSFIAANTTTVGPASPCLSCRTAIRSQPLRVAADAVAALRMAG